ncbi:hypothetical protein MuYL_3837 [Mucilaginibacter xinganensis]|uniref:Uncharacterized protein n=1 Tax=Mucilaginibacter xinganensis TaxID=1234841 RepID=A0A223P0T5_9SPHI|nr:hypothetical protein MuYL_3837 [Mucilaginibacter xinganensis]
MLSSFQLKEVLNAIRPAKLGIVLNVYKAKRLNCCNIARV